MDIKSIYVAKNIEEAAAEIERLRDVLTILLPYAEAHCDKHSCDDGEGWKSDEFRAALNQANAVLARQNG